jgi:hypothetical protein
MASIKELKDDINILTFDLINECFTYKILDPEMEADADKVLNEIIKLRNDLIHRVNNPEDTKDSKKLKSHFNKIKADLGKLVKMVEELGKDG